MMNKQCRNIFQTLVTKYNDQVAAEQVQNEKTLFVNNILSPSLPYVPVLLQYRQGRQTPSLKLLLDSGSQASLLTLSTIKQLGLDLEDLSQTNHINIQTPSKVHHTEFFV